MVKIANAEAAGIWQGGTALGLGAQVDQPIGGRDLIGCDKTKAILRLWRTVKTETAKAMTDRLESDELTQRIRLYSSQNCQGHLRLKAADHSHGWPQNAISITTS